MNCPQRKPLSAVLLVMSIGGAKDIWARARTLSIAYSLVAGHLQKEERRGEMGVYEVVGIITRQRDEAEAEIERLKDAWESAELRADAGWCEAERLRSAMNRMFDHLEACHADDEIGVELLAELRGYRVDAECGEGEG